MADLTVGHYRFTKLHGVAVGRHDKGSVRTPVTFREKELLEEIERLREKIHRYAHEVSLLESQLELSQDSLAESRKQAKRLFSLLDGSKD